MRSEQQIIELLLSVAKADERIRAVILSGSRANKRVVRDDLQDFDVVFLVNELRSFQTAPNWIDVFGERIILQMPNSMKIDEHDLEAEKEEITYLMLFKDHNRLDLKLMEVKNKVNCRDSLNRILLDKDELFDRTVEPTEEDYLIKRPTQKEFLDCCNEFWWVSTYVVKGLARDEPLYAKEMLEGPLRKMFMKMLAWSVGSKAGFAVNLGKSNRFLKEYVSPAMWTKILATYPDAQIINIWNSFRKMTGIFHEVASHVAAELGLHYNTEEAVEVQQYLSDMEQRIVE